MTEGKISVGTIQEREKLFIALYKNSFPVVARYISKMGGTFDEAKDIFQDALVIYYEKAASGLLALKTNESAYLMGIAKHLWLKKHHDDSKLVSIDGLDAENGEEAQFADHKNTPFPGDSRKKNVWNY